MLITDFGRFGFVSAGLKNEECGKNECIKSVHEMRISQVSQLMKVIFKGEILVAWGRIELPTYGL